MHVSLRQGWRRGLVVSVALVVGAIEEVDGGDEGA
jgi:hypothetical protein